MRRTGEDDARKPSGDEPPQTPFSTIALYVFGFMTVLGLLAFLAAWCVRR